MSSSSNRLVRYTSKVGRIVGLPKLLDCSAKLRFVDESGAPGDFLRTSNLRSLSPFKGADERGCLEKTVGGPGVEPCIAATHHLDPKLSLIKIGSIDVGNLQLAACRRFDVARNIDDLLVVEI